MEKTAAVIVAGGSGKRLPGAVSKQYLEIAGKPILLHTLEAFSQCSAIDQIVLVLPEADIAWFKEILRQRLSTQKCIRFVAGGNERQQSVYNGLKALGGKDIEIVCVHDGVRPFVSEDTIVESIRLARQCRAAVAGVPVKDTIKQVGQNQQVVQTPDRQVLWQVQTPQAFEFALLLQAHEKAMRDGYTGTDDAMLVEHMGQAVKMSMGSYRNIKITTADDINYADFLLSQIHQEDYMQRVGIGYDVHQLVAGRPLVLGGITIPHELGLLGHSDADVLIHALMDALLGAAGMGDIGRHFPDTDVKYKGIASTELLEQVVSKLEADGYRIGNVDVIVMAQRPKLAPFISEMQSKLSDVLKIDAHYVNIKATTTEGLGFVGREEGIAAQATAVLHGR